MILLAALPCRVQHTSLSYLSVLSSLNHRHNDVFRGHEGELMADVSLNDFWVDHQTLCDVLQGAEDDVCCQERLWEGNPPIKKKRVGGK